MSNPFGRRPAFPKGTLPSVPCGRGHFEWHIEGSTGYARCRQCQRDRAAEWRHGNRDKYLTSKRRTRIRRTYGNTWEQKEELWERQGRACAICARPLELRSAPVDHCHKTGDVRGLLCRSCNTFIGRIEANSERMDECLKYLSR